MALRQTSMAKQKVAAYIALAEKSEGLWNALIVFLGALLLLGAFPFYPTAIIFLLAIVCGVIALKNPPLGVIAGAILALPAILYQSSFFGWAYLLIIALVLFEVFENWMIIATLEILILAPFAFSGFALSGWITIVGMAAGALYFGSRKSIAIALPAVVMILLLSAVWGVTNTAYLPISLKLYQPGIANLKLTKNAVDYIDVIPSAVAAFGDFLSFKSLGSIFDSVGAVFGNLITLAISDSLILQLIVWGGALYLIALLSGNKGKHVQLVSSLPLLLVGVAYYGIYLIYSIPFRLEFAGSIIFAIVLLGVLEQAGIMISRESELERKEKMKSYGKFGMSDISLGGSEKSMNDVGGYEDVKEELRSAIMLPLEKKEIAFTYGIKPPSGILLFGPPGTGKTMLMRALAKELRYNFVEVRCSQILSQWYGESIPGNEKIVVRDNSGKIKLEEIEKIVENKEKVEVLSFDGQGKAVFAKIKDWIKHKGGTAIYEVRTRSGRKIKVTSYHSLFALNGTKIESVMTSQLIEKQSYIAIPNAIPFAQKPIEEIDFIEALAQDDFGLYVKNGHSYVGKAVEKIGMGETLKILNYKNEKYLKDIVKRKVGIRVKSFLKLMKKSSVKFEKEKIRIGSGSKTLPGIVKIDENLATFIGLWVAEGSYNRKETVRISTSANEIEKISNLCRKLFGHITVYNKGGGRDIYIGSRPLYVFLREILDLNQGSNEKKLPQICLSFSKKNMAAALRGYFSGDGSVYENQRGVATVEALTTSNELANQLLYLLLYFGIVARVYPRKEWNGTNSYRVCMMGGGPLTKFKEIGFLEQSKMKRISDSIARVKWFRSEQIPLPLSLRNHFAKWTNSPTIGKDILVDSDIEEEFIEQIENNIYLDRVEEIKKLSKEKTVYDISVDPCQNFVAGFGGIFAHNSEKNVAEVFTNARKNAPTILFFDEIDSIAKQRNSEGTDEVGPRVLTTLLQEMDGGSKSKSTVMVVGATNMPQELDHAIMRPGRFDKIIYMHLPDFDARKKIFEVDMKGLPLEDNIDLDLLAKKTDRFSGADIKNIVEETKRFAAKEASLKGIIIPLTMEHFLEVISQIKPSTPLSQLELYEQFRLDFERSIGMNQPKKAELGENVKWEDVAGLSQVKKTLLETIQLPLLYEKEMKELKVKPYKGVLLFGPPGTGKTLIVKAASNELKASFQSLSSAELMKKGYTQAVTIVKETFNRARENAPAIIFVDEIETFAPARGSSGSSEILGQFLTELDGIKELKGVIIIAATNKPGMLDPAILRPGRFDKIFYIPPPSAEDRAEIFKIHLGQFADKVDLNMLAAASEGFSGADIAGLAQDLKMEALRSKISGKEFDATTAKLLKMIKKRRPSITQGLLDEYKAFIDSYGERSDDEDSDDDKKTPPQDTHYR